MHRQPSPEYARTSLKACVALMVVGMAAACGENGFSTLLPAADIVAVDAEPLRGSVGTALTDPVRVRVLSEAGEPLAGAPVTFTTDNGVVDPTHATTDGNGMASTRWELGHTAGVGTLTARSGSGVSVTVTAQVLAGEPADATVAAGAAQSAAVGSAVPVRPGVRVTDAFGNATADVPVVFTVTAGGGSVVGQDQRTGADGTATVGDWILGPALGTQTLSARVEAEGLGGIPLLFTATGELPTEATMTASSGDGQEAPVGTAVAVRPTVTVRSPDGGSVSGVVVTFEVTAGGGTVVQPQQVTDATGSATVGDWVLGSEPGDNELTARAEGLSDVRFTARGGPGEPATMEAASATSQSTSVGAPVTDPPAVVVRDDHGIPVPGVQVGFDATAGGGRVDGTPALTDESGVARLSSWTVGPVPGDNVVTATTGGLTAVTFHATGTVGAPAQVVAVAGMGQAAVQGTRVESPPRVRVTDARGNGVPGVGVTFAVTSGGGSASGGARTTDLQGEAAVERWTLGAEAPNQLTATVAGPGISGNPVVFVALSATAVSVSGAPRSVKSGKTFSISARITDADGAPVPLAGVTLTVEMASGGGALVGTLSRATDENGAVDFTDLLVVGGKDKRTFRISGEGLAAATTDEIEFK